MDSADFKIEIEQPNTAQPVLEQEDQLQPQVIEQVNQTAIQDFEAGKGTQEIDEEASQMKLKVVSKSLKTKSKKSTQSRMSIKYPIRGRPLHNVVNNENSYSPNKEFCLKKQTVFSFGNAKDRYYDKQTLRDRKQITGPGTYNPTNSVTKFNNSTYSWSKNPVTRFEYKKLQGADQIQYVDNERNFWADAKQGKFSKTPLTIKHDNQVPGAGSYNPNKEYVKQSAPSIGIKMDAFDKQLQFQQQSEMMQATNTQTIKLDMFRKKNKENMSGMNSKTTRKMNKVPSYMKNIGNAKAQVVR